VRAKGSRTSTPNVLPAMKQTPGLASGYWLASKEGQGLTVLVFDNAEGAQAMAEGLVDTPKADFATLGTVEVRNVVAHMHRRAG
jgi:hypothetical protein